MTGRAWVYVRDDRPFGGQDPPPRCSTTRVIAPVIIPSVTSQAMSASCRPTLMPVSTGSISQLAGRDR